MSRYTIKPFSPEGLKTYPLRSRPSKVRTSGFSAPFAAGSGIRGLLESLPDILAGRDFKDFVGRMKSARARGRTVIFGMGGHVIKVGLSPLIIDLMTEGWITALALNGACIVHDFEIAYAGKTSEDVETQIREGRFGMSEETGRLLNEAIAGSGTDEGMGEAVARMIGSSRFPHKNLSVLARAHDLEIPVTVHTAPGTDIIHVHPSLDAEAFGRTAVRDFYLFCSLVERLNGGGVYMNVGSAVLLPEVFLKALSAVRGKGGKVEGFTTAVFDFNRHYRPEQNVVRRPVGARGRGYYFIGHHELMIPLLAAALKA